MFSDRISDYFEGVAAKYLSAVDADPSRSHQHEIGGLPAVGFRQHLGTPEKDEKRVFPARMVYLTDPDEAPDICEDVVTWYDCRSNDPSRSAEYRLYYKANPVTDRLAEGDFLLIAKLRNNSLLLVFTPAGSNIESQMRALFGIGVVGAQFRRGSVNASNLLLPLRLLLDQLGVAVFLEGRAPEAWLETMLRTFGDTGFPTTTVFSDFSRNTITAEVDAIKDPDGALLAWMEQEEILFRIFERHLVAKQLEHGFGKNGKDVDAFISFSLSVQNRRKARVGHAFETHLGVIFRMHGLAFEQGRGKDRVTEHNSKPDFLFPGFAAYRNPSFPSHLLHMLGAKTTCKDRWRQVLAEANRVERKHLVTMEAAISEGQTGEMKSHGLQLVVPRAIQSTYTQEQARWLYSLADFIREIHNSQDRPE